MAIGYSSSYSVHRFNNAVPVQMIPLQRMTMLVTHKKTNLRGRQRPVVDLDFVYYAIVKSVCFLGIHSYSEIVRLDLYGSLMSHSGT